MCVGRGIKGDEDDNGRLVRRKRVQREVDE